MKCNLRQKNTEYPSRIMVLFVLSLIVIVTGITELQYALAIVSAVYFCVDFFYSKNDFLQSKIHIAFLALILIQLIGVFYGNNPNAIKNVVTTWCIVFIITTVSNSYNYVDKLSLICLYGLASLGAIFVNKQSVNLVSGYYVFYMLGILALWFIQLDTIKISVKKHIKIAIFAFFTLLPAIILSIALGGRAALFSIILGAFSYIAFYLLKDDKKQFKYTFYIFLTIAVILIVIYINIKDMFFYDYINQISIKMFNKHIDSGRPGLWKESLSQLNGWQWIFGCGTGQLPTIAGYENSSFHNSFIQLLVQNGLIGLFVFIYIFWSVWMSLIKIKNKEIRAFFLACYMSIVFYSCFETCLIQNKTFLGILQWITLFIGVSYSHKQNKTNCNKLVELSGCLDEIC